MDGAVDRGKYFGSNFWPSLGLVADIMRKFKIIVKLGKVLLITGGTCWAKFLFQKVQLMTLVSLVTDLGLT
jgi:hypothetical protein